MKNLIKAFIFWLFPKRFITNNPYMLYLWGKQVKKRDGKCLACGKTERLEAHHVYPKKQYPRLALRVNNGVTLCKNCHTKDKDSWHRLHGYKKGGWELFRSWLIKKRKNISSINF